jgi:hypothetical protein
MSIIAPYQSGHTLYFVVVNDSGNYWNGSAFVNTSTANTEWAICSNNLTDQTNNQYIGNFPITIGPGIYYVYAYLQSGPTPNILDQRVLVGAIEWNGSSEGSSGSIPEFAVSIGDQAVSVTTGTTLTGSKNTSDSITFVGGVR